MGGMGEHLHAIGSLSRSSSPEEELRNDAPPAQRQKRKYRCRVRSPATIARARRTRRDKANARERRRMNSLNDALEELRTILPQTGEEPKMTKIETLRTAQQYIAYLIGSLSTTSDAASTLAALSATLNSPSFIGVPHPDMNTVSLMHAHLHGGGSVKSENYSCPPTHESALYYTPDPSPVFSSFQMGNHELTASYT